MVVGVSKGTDWTADASRLPVVGRPYGGLNLEKILQLRPDVVVAYPQVAPSLRQRGLKVLDVKLNSLQGIIKLVKTLGRLTGKEKKAALLRKELVRRIQLVDDQVNKAKDRPLVYFEAGSQGRSRGPGSLTHELIMRAGGVNLATGSKVSYPLVSAETVLWRNPDVIILEDYGLTSPSQLASRPGWSRIKAIRERRVYLAPPYFTSYGPRCVDGLEQMARWFHPELFDR